jgi:GTP-binding protein Era
MDSPFKAGFVVLLGRPNAGKSTLMNALLKKKLSIVSPKPQTTRHKILGILDGEGYQACFLDTPGLIPDPRDPLQGLLRKAAKQAAQDDSDLTVLLVEPAIPDAASLGELQALTRSGAAVILALNKTDLPQREGFLDQVLETYRKALEPVAVIKLSALKGTGVPDLLAEILKRLPESPAFYEQGQLSDRWERFFAAEIIREQVFRLYSDEIPHATAIVIETFREKKPRNEIQATLYIERDGQKGIILGPKGGALRKLVEGARAGIEDFIGRAVDLDVWVKVRKNWRKDPKSLKEFGY